LTNAQANVQALAEGQTVSDVFTYTNSDNHSATSSSPMTEPQTGTNDAPSPLPDVASVKEDTNTVPQPNPVSGNLLSNDTDVDTNDTHRVPAVTGGTDNGTTITVTGTYAPRFTPLPYTTLFRSLTNAQANVQALAEGQTVSDVFTYTNSDNHSA